MPSQHQDAGYGGGGGSGGQKKGGNQTLRTLTIRQLAKDLANADDDCLIVDGVQLENVCVVGKIVSVHDRNNSVVVVLSDGTGELEVNHWLPEESEHAMQNKKAELRPGVYVKAHGNMRTSPQDKKLCLSAFNIRLITNFNEVTYHFLRSIFEHLHLTKGGAGAAQGMAAAGGMSNPAGAGWRGAPQQQPIGGATTFAGAGGGDSCQAAVLDVLQKCNGDNGLHITEIHNKLAPQYNKAQIEQALQGLMNDAHAYNTVDDFHFKST